MSQSRSSVTPAAVALRVAIVGLALGTAYIHATLGGLLFTLNALGYEIVRSTAGERATHLEIARTGRGVA